MHACMHAFDDGVLGLKEDVVRKCLRACLYTCVFVCALASGG